MQVTQGCKERQENYIVVMYLPIHICWALVTLEGLIAIAVLSLFMYAWRFLSIPSRVQYGNSVRYAVYLVDVRRREGKYFLEATCPFVHGRMPRAPYFFLFLSEA